MARRWCAYLLWCSDGSLYAGATNDLDARIAKHNAGKGARYTRSRGPVKLARAFFKANRSAALKSEAAIKRLGRAEKLALLKMKTLHAHRRIGPTSVRGGTRQNRGKTPAHPRHGS